MIIFDSSGIAEMLGYGVWLVVFGAYLVELFYFLTSIIRIVRWVALVQQKEYRWDRLRLWLRTTEGRREVIGLIHLTHPLKSLSKRPKRTVKSILLLLFSLVIWLISWQILAITSNLGVTPWDEVILEMIIIPFLYWFLIPVMVLIASIPLWLLTQIVTNWRLQKAKILIDKHRPLIIGITGSYGKTSTRHLLSHLLGDKTQVWTPADSHNTRLSIATDTITHYQGQPIVVLEYGAYTQSEIAKLTQSFPPQVAIMTGLTYQHGGLFGSLEKIIQAKSELIVALPEKAGIYWNGECQEVEKIVKIGLNVHRRRHTQSQVEVKRIDPSQVEMSNVSVTNQGQLQFQFANQTIVTSVVGKHYAENIALAIAVARDQGIPTSRIVARLQSFQPNRYFTRTWQSQTGVIVIDDGGSCNPAGFDKILDLAKLVDGSSKVLITSGIVDLGVESKRIHRELAIKSKSIIDQVLYTGESGREEFQAVLGNQVMTDQKAIVEKLKTFQSGTLLIIEGRLPGWVVDLIPKN